MSEIESSIGPLGSIVADNTQAPEGAQPEATAGATEATPPTPEVPDKFAAKFAALSRREKMLRDQEKSYATRVSELEQKLKAYEEQSKNQVNTLDRFKKEPLKVMEEAGLTYEELSEIILNNNNPTPEMLIKRTREELESNYKKDIEQLRQQLQDKEQKEQDARVEAIKGQYMEQLSTFVNGSEKYELIQANDAVSLVYDVVEAAYESSGGKTIMSMEEASNRVETYLENQAKKIFELKKFKQTSQPPKEQDKAKTAAPTLSNTLASQVPTKGARQMSNAESLAEAAKLIRWDE